MLFELFGIDGGGITPLIFDVCFLTLLGLCFGSFTSAIAYRIPRGLPWATSRSRSQCAKCKNVLHARDLIPVFSWLIAQGKCRQCEAPISPRYPVLEALSTFLVFTVYLLHSGAPSLMIPIIFAIPFLLSLTVIDLEFKILPNQLIAILLGLGALYMGLKFYHTPDQGTDILANHVGGMALYFLLSRLLAALMSKILKKNALGMGDVKFFAVAGLWLGIPMLGIYCILAGLMGVFLGLIWKCVKGEDVFPFGPALIAAFFLLLILDGSPLLEKTLQYLQ